MPLLGEVVSATFLRQNPGSQFSRFEAGSIGCHQHAESGKQAHTGKDPPQHGQGPTHIYLRLRHDIVIDRSSGCILGKAVALGRKNNQILSLNTSHGSVK